AAPTPIGQGVFSINAAHTYAEAGTYAYTVTVTDDGGAVTVISGSAIIADAALSPKPVEPMVSTTEASIFPVPAFGKPGTGTPAQGLVGPVVGFQDANPGATTSDFTATIDWGDGTPITAGTVAVGGGAGPFVVNGSHIYADSGVNGGAGNYTIQV